MKTLTAKFSGTCDLCGSKFPAGETIGWNGRAHHVACLEQDAQAQKAAELADSARQIEWTAERKAGKHIAVVMTETEIVIRNAWDYAQAKAFAFDLITNAQVASGERYTIKCKTDRRTGKRTVGRSIYFGGHNGTMAHHDGWAFGYAVGA